MEKYIYKITKSKLFFFCKEEELKRSRIYVIIIRNNEKSSYGVRTASKIKNANLRIHSFLVLSK